MVDPIVPEWTFTFSEEHWVPSRIPEAEPNLVAAVETFAASFRSNARSVELTLEAWQASEKDGSEGGVNVTTAAIRRVGDGLAEFRDKYKQFDNVRIPVEEVDGMLRRLVLAVRSRHAS